MCAVTVVCDGNVATHVLHALPTQDIARVELCSIKSIEQDMRHGCDAWLMLVQPTSDVAAMEADTCAGVGEGSGLNTGASCWNNLVAEFADVFELPGMPAECKTVHRIELQPGATPLFMRQY